MFLLHCLLCYRPSIDISWVDGQMNILPILGLNQSHEKASSCQKITYIIKECCLEIFDCHLLGLLIA